tara:strand:- start:2345 stop:2680 length:336 start_codon:yes stop_codon:yes gene_type:complete
MPLVKVTTSSTNIDINSLSGKLSEEISFLTNKPEKYVMVIIEINKNMIFSGQNIPSAYVEIKSIGALRTKSISESISRIFQQKSDVASSRIYISFEDISPSNWGYNGSTFG